MLQLAIEHVQALAPDAASLAAGKKLGNPGVWRNLGRSARVLWGECQGSALYRTEVAIADLASKCSCPSRKFPCKHSLGLLFLAMDAPGALADGAEPPWVAEWLEKRETAREKKQQRVAEADKPEDPVAQTRRAEKRHANLLEGLDHLDAWMNDLVRQGIARARSEAPSFWDRQARRLVDAQAPGLAARVRRIAARVGNGDDWSAHLLDDLGSLALLTHAYRRLAELEPLLQADVLRLVGSTLDRSEVVAHGDVVEDDWTVVAEATGLEERLRVQRCWLRGRDSKRSALVLQFAAGGGGFEQALALGTRLRARLAYWPSAWPQRALIAERSGPGEPDPAPPPGESVTAACSRFAEALARLPWTERELFLLSSVVPSIDPQEGGRALLIDDDGTALPLDGREHTLLIALSGGLPIAVSGEFDGYAFSPRCAWADGHAVSLVRSAE